MYEALRSLIARRHLAAAVAVLVAASALANCDDNAGCPDGDAGTSCEEQPVSTAPATSSSSSAAGGSGGHGGGTGGGGGSGYDDSCADDGTCPPGMYCEPYSGYDPPVICSPWQGTCRYAEPECSNEYRPVCTCGGFLADNRCEGRRAGFDMAFAVDCDPPAGTFRCGAYNYCVLGVEYCSAFTSTYGNTVERGGECLPLPAACETVNGCPCLSEEVCDDGAPPVSCGGATDTGLTLECVF